MSALTTCQVPGCDAPAYVVGVDDKLYCSSHFLARSGLRSVTKPTMIGKGRSGQYCAGCGQSYDDVTCPRCGLRS